MISRLSPYLSPPQVVYVSTVEGSWLPSAAYVRRSRPNVSNPHVDDIKLEEGWDCDQVERLLGAQPRFVRLSSAPKHQPSRTRSGATRLLNWDVASSARGWFEESAPPMHVDNTHSGLSNGRSSASSPNQPTWTPIQEAPAFDPNDIMDGVLQPRVATAVVVDPRTGHRGIGLNGQLGTEPNAWPVLAHLPPMYPEWLGDRGFTETHQARFPYVIGAMANGIATVALVKAAAEHGFLGFFGAAGLSLPRVEAALDQLRALDAEAKPWGSNLIHSPNEPSLEAAVVELYLQRNVRRVSASAYMDLTLPLIRYATKGLKRTPDGHIHRTNYVFAKISRPEVATRFLAPPPSEALDRLVRDKLITPEEAELARYVPIAEDITVESDSGGHTDNQALGALFPTIARVRDQATQTYGYTRPIRVGAAGGLGTPLAVASAFSLGAAYVLTGSVNQACVESGLAEEGRRLLAQASLADVTMAPAADMFEMGVDVQVLKRGTMFAQRGHHLRTLYKQYPSLEAIPASDRARIEKSCFRKPLEEAWQDTRNYWIKREPQEAEKADKDPKHKMALLFRAYLGQASRWAIDGLNDRIVDYQIWCGPAMGAFNHWVKGSFLEPAEARTAGQVGLNLLEGATVALRANQLRSFGVPVPPQSFDFRPRPLDATIR